MSLDLNDLIAKTPRGMAHATGTGPVDTTCRTCRFWAGNNLPVFEGDVWFLMPGHERRRWEGPVPAPQACWRYRQLKRGQLDSDDRSARVPASQPSCSHYRAYDGEAQAERREIKAKE